MERNTARIAFFAALWLSLAAVGTIRATPPAQAWVARYHHPFGGTDYFAAQAVDSAGNTVVAGTTVANAAEWDTDFLTAKYDSSGTLLWSRRYDGPANNEDEATAATVDNAGNVIVTGSSASFQTHNDFATVKYDALGTQLWAVRCTSPGMVPDKPAAVKTDGQNNVIVAGTTGLTPQLMLVKYSSGGAELWRVTFLPSGVSELAVVALAIDGSGNILVAGHSTWGSTLAVGMLLMKFSAAGAHQWTANAPAIAEMVALAVNAAGEAVVTGATARTTTPSGANSQNIALAKFGSDGSLQWQRTYGNPSPGFDQARAMTLDPTGNVYVAGKVW